MYDIDSHVIISYRAKQSGTSIGRKRYTKKRRRLSSLSTQLPPAGARHLLRVKKARGNRRRGYGKKGDSKSAVRDSLACEHYKNDCELIKSACATTN